MLPFALAASPINSQAAISCGSTITQNTTLTADLTCPSGTALTIGAAGITLDLGGHTISGATPHVGIMVTGRDGITIRNGFIAGFERGVFLNNSDNAIMEYLTVINMTVDDPNHFIFGVVLVDSQNVSVRHMAFEFLPVAHKEGVEVYASTVTVDHIEVSGGGAGVSFSFIGSCDPLSSPSNGVVRDSIFTDIAVAGIWIACSSDVLIEGNEFSSPAGTGLLGIQADPPLPDAVSNVIIRNNLFYTLKYGIDIRGLRGSSIINNSITYNQYWGIFMEHSLGCIDPDNNPGWECFNSTGNTITDNFVLGNGGDLYHDASSSGNTWERNVCRVKSGAEIPECIPPFTQFLPTIR